MLRCKLPAVAMLLALTACQKSDTKILIGATTVTEAGGRPIEGSVIVVSGSKIRAVGLQKDVPIPQDSERTNLAGKWVAPPAGGKIAPGETATFDVLDHAPPGSATKQMVAGEWREVR